MRFFFKITNHKKGDRYDLEIVHGRFKIYFLEKYRIIQLMGDIFVGLFFVAGSLMNLLGVNPLYGSYAFLTGSIILILRPILQILKNTWVYKEKDG